jgi:hypothetical protein
MPTVSKMVRLLLTLLVLSCGGVCAAPQKGWTRLDLPREAREGMETLYRGDADAAIQIFRRLEASQPDSPVGYLLEADARWWKIYLRSLEFKWNMLDVQTVGASAENDEFLRVDDKAAALAEAQLEHGETAPLHLYAGMAYLLRARLIGLRGDRSGTARAGVRGRTHFLRAKELDPRLADADTGIGLYNYYIDTLSTLARVLRFLMGIPGGSKKDGVVQLTNAMENGDLTAVEARFYLAKNLRLYDQEYERAGYILEPLVKRYPQNPNFALLLGNINALLNRKEKAAACYRAAEAISKNMPASDAGLRDRVAALAREGLASLNTQPR